MPVVPDVTSEAYSIETGDGHRLALRWYAKSGSTPGSAVVTVLRGHDGTRPVAPSIAPARNTKFAGLAPAYIEVGEMDVFRDEDVGYARQLWRAGVSTELHVHPGMPHAFDVLLLGDDLRYQADKLRVIRSV